jgi:predicted amidohydrolase YtcJ
LGVHVTIQHPLLYALGAQLVVYWGPERTREVMPVKSWLDEGASLSAGTDYPVGSFNPLEAIWGMVTRETQRNGVQGAGYAVDVRTAFDLYTRGGAALDDETATRGTLEPGKLADFVGYPADPFACAVDDLRTLRLVFTNAGGRITSSRHADFSE